MIIIFYHAGIIIFLASPIAHSILPFSAFSLHFPSNHQRFELASKQKTESGTPGRGAQQATANRNPFTPCAHPSVFPSKSRDLHFTMATTIDFASLLRKEKRKAEKKRIQTTRPAAKTVPASDGDRDPDRSFVEKKQCVLPRWKVSQGPLNMDHLNLEMVIQDPKTVYYSSRSISHLRALEDWLQNLPSGDSGLAEWKIMKYGKRKAAMFGETEGTPLVGPLAEIATLLVQRGVFPAEEPPNHVLLNGYSPGQGILPHTDGPAYASRTATLSLMSSVVLEFRKRLSSDEIGSDGASSSAAAAAAKMIQVLLEPGSMIVFEDEAYLDYCHGIPMDAPADIATSECVNAPEGTVVSRGHRFSLTFRHKKKARGAK